MIRSEKIIVKKDEVIDKWLQQATAIYDQSLYYLRQEYFQAEKEHRKPDYKNIKLYDLVKETEVWKNSDLDSNAKQYVIRNVSDNWFSFYKTCKAYWKDRSKFKGSPKLPRYLEKKNKSSVLIFDKSRLRQKDEEHNTLCLPKSKRKIQIPKYIKISSIKCITVSRYYGKLKLTISYEKEVEKRKLNQNSYLGIDIGVNNIVAITINNQNKSWIVKGGCIKSINQFYNKKLAEYKSILEKLNKKKTSKRIQRLNMKRKHKLDFEFHILSKKIVDLCVENDVGNIVIGHNKWWKQNINMGKRNNQNFSNIPFNDLIHKIQYKAEEVGINCLLTEESHTSKIDHLVNEEMKKQDSYLGKRVKRGLFKSSCGKILNADINGAIGILRKLKAFSDVELINLRDRGDVVSPLILKYKS